MTKSWQQRIARDSLWIAVLLASGLPVSSSQAQERRDEFFYLGEINKASSVMVVEQGIVPKPLGKSIADSVTQVIADGNKPGAKRSGDYLEMEKFSSLPVAPM